MWSQIVLTLLGIWLMVSPGVFDFPKEISDNAHIVGPLIGSFSMIAIWECTRNVRWLNLPLALWLLAAPWILAYHHTIATVNDYIVAVLVIVLTFVRPQRKYRFGGGWPAAWKDNTLHSREAGNG